MTEIFVMQSLFSASMAMLPLIFGGGTVGIGESDAKSRPLAEICILPDQMPDNICAAFFLSGDGYEICVRNDISGTFRCSGIVVPEDDDDDIRSTGFAPRAFEI